MLHWSFELGEIHESNWYESESLLQLYCTYDSFKREFAGQRFQPAPPAQTVGKVKKLHRSPSPRDG